MNMKKISCAVIVAAASMSSIMAADSPASAPGSASAPGPDSSFAMATLPVFGSLLGASFVSFFSYYLQ
ncbi:Detected protein of confused Function [Hibiscus syriacus]|uniref:Detected protein of confused Function n=1 Tax=Hibiscus syriacus TaxID=106335 RepID=A0A6A2ZTM8_HIBSY|nr:Detected protein of confused Function [Hibiscus syriacus]